VGVPDQLRVTIAGEDLAPTLGKGVAVTQWRRRFGSSEAGQENREIFSSVRKFDLIFLFLKELEKP
jgi:hypothetical protein